MNREPFRRGVGFCVAAGLLLGAVGGLRGEEPAKTTPTEEEIAAAKEEARFDKVTEFLLSEYARIGESKDWLTRSLGAISVSRLPQSRANRALLKILKEDPTPAVQLVAWQCLLARAKTIDPEQFDAWMVATPALVDKNVFNGRLRIDLLKMLALSPPDVKAKRIFLKIYEETNSLEVNDIPVIDELGRTLAAWKSPDIVQGLLERMKTFNHDFYRAEVVLQTAGCTAPWAGTRADESSQAMWIAATKDYLAWWQKDRENWKEMKTRAEGTPWRDATSMFLSVSLFDREAVKANNPEVRRDLELGNPGLKKFDVAFVVDATESMGPPMAWLKDDIRKMMTVMGMLSSQPRIALTFYRDPGYVFVAKTYPLTKDVGALINVLAQTPALGGKDNPESVREGLVDCVKNAGWDLSSRSGAEAIAGTQAAAENTADRKVMILMGDAPPHPGTEKDCETIAKKASEQGFKVYTVKLTTPLGETKGNLPTFDAIAAAGNGMSFAVSFAGSGYEFRGTAPAKKTNMPFVHIAKNDGKEAPSRQLLTRILCDAMNPKYRERIEMLVPILLEMCERPNPEVRRPFGPAPEPQAGPGPARKPAKQQQK
jgi:hypothetical protein